MSVGRRGCGVGEYIVVCGESYAINMLCKDLLLYVKDIVVFGDNIVCEEYNFVSKEYILVC